MSRQETHRGRLIEIWHCDEIFDLKKQLKYAFPDEEYSEMLKCCEDAKYTVKEYINDELWDKYILYNNSLYKIEDTEMEYDYIDEFREVSDGVYEYLNSFL